MSALFDSLGYANFAALAAWSIVTFKCVGTFVGTIDQAARAAKFALLNESKALLTRPWMSAILMFGYTYSNP